MARFIHETGMRERRNIREAARHTCDDSGEWAVIDAKSWDIIQGGFDSREEAEAWLKQLPPECAPNCPNFMSDPDTRIEVQKIE